MILFYLIVDGCFLIFLFVEFSASNQIADEDVGITFSAGKKNFFFFLMK